MQAPLSGHAMMQHYNRLNVAIGKAIEAIKGQQRDVPQKFLAALHADGFDVTEIPPVAMVVREAAE